MKFLALLFLLSGCSWRAFKRPEPLPASAEAFCKPHFDKAYAATPKSKRLNKTSYNYDQLNQGLREVSANCYQRYIDHNLDRHQGKIACLHFAITKEGVQDITFADVGVFNPPDEVKKCASDYLQAARSNIKGKDKVFVEQVMLFYTRVSR
jgi:hypothetical protein